MAMACMPAMVLARSAPVGITSPFLVVWFARLAASAAIAGGLAQEAADVEMCPFGVRSCEGKRGRQHGQSGAGVAAAGRGLLSAPGRWRSGRWRSCSQPRR